jgi:hypothetical protein
MKKPTIFVASLILVFALCNFANAQTIQITIVNQSAVLGVGPSTSYFQFDINLKATVGDIYLGGSDIVLSFNSTNFTSPTIQINDGSDDGSTFASLMNSNSVSVNSQATSYEDMTVPVTPITSNLITLNVSGPTPGTQTVFNKSVAKLSNGVTYTYGTYRIYGISNSSGTMGLVWVSASTKIYTFANTTPWNQSLVTNDLPAITDHFLPVELTSFTASVSQLNTTLQWSTATEVNNYGFDIERRVVSNQPSAVSSWTKVGFVQGNGTSNDKHSYSFSENITVSGTYAYRLKQIDNGGAFKYSQEAQVTIEVPKVFMLNQNYPNPFNPTTTISFTLAQDGMTTLKIFDIMGREVATLANGMMKAGVIQQVTFDASRLSSGIYFSCLENNGLRQIKKIVLMK